MIHTLKKHTCPQTKAYPLHVPHHSAYLSLLHSCIIRLLYCLLSINGQNTPTLPQVYSIHIPHHNPYLSLLHSCIIRFLYCLLSINGQKDFTPPPCPKLTGIEWYAGPFPVPSLFHYCIVVLLDSCQTFAEFLDRKMGSNTTPLYMSIKNCTNALILVIIM